VVEHRIETMDTKIDLSFSLSVPSEPGYYAVWRMVQKEEFFVVNLYRSFVSGEWFVRPTGQPESKLNDWLENNTFVQWSQRLSFSFSNKI